jgi:hypothetical protein
MPTSNNPSPDSQTGPNIFSQPLSIFGIPVDRETIFSNHKATYKSRVEKRQRKLIVQTTFIKFFLRAGERIRCLTTGYSPISVIEQILTGLAFVVFKRARLIFTDKRLLHIPNRFKGNGESSISQIMYEDCAKIQLKGRQLIIYYKNGYIERFPYIARKEKKKIKALLANLPLRPKEAGNLKGRVYLCPSCTNTLEYGVFTCQACNLGFKSSRQARMWAVSLPGGGYFFTRYPILGSLVGLIETIAIGFLIFQTIAAAKGHDPNIGMLTAVTVALVVEKILATFHSGILAADFIPNSKDITMRKV